MGFARWGFCFGFVVLALTMPFATGITNPQDVMAINNLYLSLGSPPLSGWLPFGGDPCGEAWQGVVCDLSNISEIRLSGLNLGGSLSDTMGDFVSIIAIDLSNNHIEGSIPQTLPSTVRNFSLSGNQLNGSIPFTFSFLSELLDLSLNNNLLVGEIPNVFQQLTGLINLDISGNNLTGELPPSIGSLSSLKTLSLDNNLLTGEVPDFFQQLTGLINLDISGNNLTGELPPSMGSLSSLKTLHLQNNKLTGTLDALQDLPLVDLNVENNLFSGTIPPKLLNIPNFRNDGNLFNITTVSSPPPVGLPPSMAWPPSSEGEPWSSTTPPSASGTQISSRAKNFWTIERSILVAVIVSIVIITAIMCITLWRFCKTRKLNEQSDRCDEEACKDLPNNNKSLSQPASKIEQVTREPIIKPFDGYGVDSRNSGFGIRQRDGDVLDVMSESSNYKKEHKLVQHPLPPPPMFFTSDEAAKKVNRLPSSVNSSSSVSVFTIASLQQSTNSFSEENFIGEGLLGNVYRAELPDGKLLAVKKLNTPSTRKQSDEEFLDLVSSISKLKHGNILELLGYCNEHAQQLLVYEYCPNGSLCDALHTDSEMHKKLTWSVRIRVALGASRALQYLHEVCQPPIVHQNFKSSNVLLDGKLAVRVADCSLAHLLPPRSTSQMSGYAAPEIELGSYSCQSDVYSLGVVMLELLTGRKSLDRTRPRGEQSLARWAIPRLHDIDALSRMVDSSLNGAYPVKSLSRFADIICRCVQMEPGFRPPISEIVQDLLHMV